MTDGCHWMMEDGWMSLDDGGWMMDDGCHWMLDVIG